jgi:hypothetical protein
MQSDADINAAATASTRLDAFMREDGTVAEALARFLSPAPAARAKRGYCVRRIFSL